MNAVATQEPLCAELVDIIDFKWLMAGMGHDVHVERMLGNPAYARQCLLRGTGVSLPMLRETAQRLAVSMGICLCDEH